MLTPTLRTQALLDLAHAHLNAAADCALREEDGGYDTVCRRALAGQIRLAAASLPPPHTPVDPRDLATGTGSGAAGHLREALTALDHIRPPDGPPDLPLSAWHVHELLRIALTAGAA